MLTTFLTPSRSRRVRVCTSALASKDSAKRGRRVNAMSAGAEIKSFRSFKRFDIGFYADRARQPETTMG